MRRWGGAVTAAVTCLVLAGCGEDVPANERAFTGPLSNDLVVTTPAECATGDVAPGEEVVVSGFDYEPGAVITLRWTVEERQETGTWPSVTAERSGEFTTSVRLTRSIADIGERVAITAEGAGISGLLVLAATVDVEKC